MNKNYSVIDKQELSELNATGYLLKHNKTNAKIVIISNDDDNKVFTIGFRTPPNDDTGLPHIMEHSVLCGSKEFPVKDPFVELAKGSLNTFLNAMTYSDKTVYPVASYNDKDFKNLMHVYLDAVFYPNIYKYEEILKQEGWHYELESKDAEITYNGVVYNEMKGVYSSGDSLLMDTIEASLLKDTSYAYNSGGNPDNIIDLTYEQFLDFHRKYYHPSNSYIYLYGNMDIEENLKFIDEHYLSKFEAKEINSEITYQEPYKEVLELEKYYSISDTDTLENNTFLSKNYIIGDSLDKELYLAFQILDYALLTAPGAILRQALIDANIGKDIYSSYDNGIKQPIFSIVAKNANKEDKEKFLCVINETVEKIVKNGIDIRSLEASINYFEFKYKEADFGRFPKGLMYGLQMFDSWLYDENKPFIHLKTNETFKFLKSKIGTGYYEDLLKKYILENTHSSVVMLLPKKGLNQENEEKIKLKLKNLKDSLTDEQLEEYIKQTETLKKYQEEPSSKEDLEKIPLIKKEDIDKKVKPLISKIYNIDNIKVIAQDVFTNEIAYIKILFDIKDLPLELVPYASLLVAVLKDVDTENYTYNELSNEINIETGGIGVNYLVYPKANTNGDFLPVFGFSGKVLFSKLNEVFRLVKEIALTSKLDNSKRLKEIISEGKSRMQDAIPSAGHNSASNRAMSYFSKIAEYRELMQGINYYMFIKDLEENFDKKQDIIIENLIKVSEFIFRKENLFIIYTANNNVEESLTDNIKEFSKDLYTGNIVRKINELDIIKKNEGFKTSSKVQYVATAGNFIDKGYKYTGALKVLQVIFSYDYLWKNVRVKGGAYGAMCSFTRFGDSYMTSYRDPNLMETYDIYKKAVDYVANFAADERDMTKYIIGAISNMDTPLTPSSKGDRSASSYIIGITEEDLQRERDELLATTQEKIRELADIVKTVSDSGIICAIGNEQKLEENKKNFYNLLSIF